MTPEEINRKIAEWLGYTVTVFKSKAGDIYYLNGSPRELPDYYHTNAAFDLLDELVERGYWVTLETTVKDESVCWKCTIETDFAKLVIETWNKSKSAAICEAIIKLIERENN